MEKRFGLRGASMVTAASLCMLFGSPALFAADKADKEEPEDATVYSGPRVAEVAVGDDPDAPKAVGIFVLPSYRSDVLRGEFVGKVMFVMLEEKKVSFWGARVVALDEDSPLRKLGLDVGDVVTRLDGVAVDTEKFEQDKIWQMPELEKHYGPTEVKWIKQGKRLVQVGQIDLGPAGAAAATALLGPFEIKLLPGFKNLPIQGFDSLPGKLVHADGRTIHYEVGIYYPPGQPRTGGAFENGAVLSAAENREVVLKQQTIGALTFDMAQTADGLTISTVSAPNRRGINFGCKAKTPAEVADALLMVLSLTAAPPPPEEPSPSPPSKQ